MTTRIRNVDRSIYQSLPSVVGFCNELVQIAKQARGTQILMPRIIQESSRHLIEDVLSHAGFGSTAQTLRIDSGMSVESEIARLLELESGSAQEVSGAYKAGARAVFLWPVSHAGERLISAYFEAFVDAAEHHAGSIFLYIPGSSEGAPARYQNVKSQWQRIAFDGGLTRREMDAYINLRMFDRREIGETGLIRQLAVEFAGWDTQLAEAIIALPDVEIMRLPDSLSEIGYPQVEMAYENWGERTFRLENDTVIHHTLRDWHLANHEGPHQQSSQIALRQRYWRACVRSLLPWMETHRRTILTLAKPVFSPMIKDGSVEVLRARQSEWVDYLDIEYGQAVGIFFDGGLKGRAVDSTQRDALSALHCGKKVRDAISHGRIPEQDKMMELIEIVGRLN